MDPTIRYIAIYLSPFGKNEHDITKHQYYFQVKEELLKYGITSQVIETKKISDPNFNYSLVNIGVAILAKLDGVPWRLQRAIYNELIVGVGAFKSINSASRSKVVPFVSQMMAILKVLSAILRATCTNWQDR